MAGYQGPIIIKRVVVAFETMDGHKGYITGNVCSTTNITVTREYYGGSMARGEIRVDDLTDIQFINDLQAQPALESIKGAIAP